MRSYPILYLLAILMVTGCVGLIQGNKLKNKISEGKITVKLTEQPTQSIRLHYTGCGGFIIQKDNDIVITDPFYSNIAPFFLVPFKKVISDESYIDKLFEPHLGGQVDLKGKVKAVMVTHAHYDHLMDAPYLYHRKLNKDSVMVIASKTSGHIMAGGAITYNDTIVDGTFIEANCYADSPNNNGEWIYTKGSRIRVMPVIGAHAPHMGKIKLYQGALVDDKRKYPHSPSSWVEGQTLTYLIDFLDKNGEPEFRIFAQTSASNDDKGIPTITDDKKIDLAIVCCSFQPKCK